MGKEVRIVSTEEPLGVNMLEGLLDTVAEWANMKGIEGHRAHTFWVDRQDSITYVNCMVEENEEI